MGGSADLSADIKKAAGDLKGAIVYYRRALEKDAQVPELNYNLALALFELSQVTEAASLLTKAIAARPNYLKAKILLARCHAGHEQYEDAKRELTRASELEPQNYAAHYRRGRLHLHLGQSADAAVALKKALQLNSSLTAAEELLILNISSCSCHIILYNYNIIKKNFLILLKIYYEPKYIIKIEHYNIWVKNGFNVVGVGFGVIT